MRRDCNVTQTQIIVNKKTLWADVATLLPFKNILALEESIESSSLAQFWSRPTQIQKIIACLAGSKDLQRDISLILKQNPNQNCANYDAWITSTVFDIPIPIHSFILASRSKTIRSAMNTCRSEGRFEDDLLKLTLDTNGKWNLVLKGIDFLTVIELVLYIYTDESVAFWTRYRQAPDHAFSYKQVRLELMKLANRLDLRNLEATARKQASSSPQSMHFDLEMALTELDFLKTGDTLLKLKDGEVLVHSDLLSRRCPFFEGLFQGRAAGRWLADRREMLSDPSEGVVDIDFTHVELSTFQLVIRHIYADSGVELFDDIVTQDLDEYLDVVLDVLSVANELMLDRLSQICQLVIGRHGELNFLLSGADIC